VYQLALMPDALDDLSRLDSPLAQRILGKLRWLAENFERLTPEPLGHDLKGAFKLRIGDYRAVYTVNPPERRLTVHLVGYRREVYRKR
jgi:mRNA interferase RelE/StbE